MSETFFTRYDDSLNILDRSEMEVSSDSATPPAIRARALAAVADAKRKVLTELRKTGEISDIIKADILQRLAQLPSSSRAGKITFQIKDIDNLLG